MAVAHNLGFPRIGADRELKKALEAYWKGELDEQGLRQVGRQLRARHWQAQLDAGIELLPVGDFAWYDQVLSHSLMFGVIPQRFRPAEGQEFLASLGDKSIENPVTFEDQALRFVGRELYDYETDPNETASLADKPEHAALVEQLSKQLNAGWKAAKPKK